MEPLNTIDVSITADLCSVVFQVESFFLKKLNAEAVEVSADQVGLDPRCGRLWIGPYYIAVTSISNRRMLDYYGGLNMLILCLFGISGSLLST